MLDNRPLLHSIETPADLRRLPEEALSRVANELRSETLNAVSQTGGHLGAGLGVIELTVALHYVFNTPHDRLIWDVGHQAYPHKILTGRRDRIHTLRQARGLYGFTKRSESEYDPFGAAHSSTAISAAYGMAVARDLKGETRHVIAVVGDGAMSAGMAYEGLNNAGSASRRFIVILNDNGMSIAPACGGLCNYLNSLVGRQKGESFSALEARVSARYKDVHAKMRARAQRKLRDLTGADATLFDNLGFDYVGPIDGHNVDQLVTMLKAARDYPQDQPLLLHVVTEKGHGYGPAEAAEDCYHGVNKFDVATGEQKKSVGLPPSYTSVFAKSLIAEAERDLKIVGITAAMPSGTGIDAFAARFPDRSFDVAIAEQHGVTFAAGMAAEGLRPFCAIYSTFLQRAYDQVVHDVALQNLPVRFVMDRAGLVGTDGATHAGSFDIAYLCCLPNFVVMAPSDEVELMHMVATAARYDEGPIALRYPRGEGIGLKLPNIGIPIEIGRGRIVREGARVAFLSFGGRLQEALKAADELSTRGLSVTVADARFAKPLDRKLILDLARHHEFIVTLEEGAMGGFATQVFHFLSDEGLLDGRVKLKAMTLPDRFIAHGTPEGMYEDAGLSSAHIVSVVGEMIGKDDKPAHGVVPLNRNASI